MLFWNSFLSYLLVYIVFGVCIVVAVFAGIKVRKSKNAKEAALEANNTDNKEE